MNTFDKKIKSLSLIPYYVEGFASFNKYGYDTPSGLSNYSDKNYVCDITGNINEKKVTVTNGNISDGGNSWACIIEDDNGLCHLNRVMSISDNTFILKDELSVNITNGKISNLHDEVSGQHYSKMGYKAFAQHIFNSKIKYSQRNNCIAQFKCDDSKGYWNANGYLQYVTTLSIHENGILNANMNKVLSLNCSQTGNYVEWEVNNLMDKNGYLETFVGTSTLESATVEFYLDDVLVSSKEVSILERVVFEFKNAKKGKIKIKPTGQPQSTFLIKVGTTTWWEVSNDSDKSIFDGCKKIAYMGDSWGEFQDKEVSLELSRLLGYKVDDYSKAGHTCKYAQNWLETSIINKNYDCAVIEYFTNDFNSIKGTNVGTFTDVDGVSKNMNITDINEYKKIMNDIITRLISNGIQPIIIMPFLTNSVSQSLGFAELSNQIWQGKNETVETLDVKNVSCSKSILTPEVSSSNKLTIISSEENSASREGVIIKSKDTLTNASIMQVKNSDETKFDFRFDGSLGLLNVKIQPITNYNDIPLNEGGRGVIYFVDESVNYSGGDAFYVVLKDSSGNFVRKKIQLI